MLLHKAPIARPLGEDLEENEPRFEGILPNVFVDYWMTEKLNQYNYWDLAVFNMVKNYRYLRHKLLG